MRTAHVLVALLVLLAGCAGSFAGGTEEATVNVYVSDEPSAIEQFQHLNVTITAFSLRAADRRGEHDDDGHHRHHHEADWTTYELNETTVDLTRLQGANASLLHAVDVPDGEYTAVAVEVADVNGTLEGGESAEVSVPGDRLLVEHTFTVGANESADFVVDAVVRERGDGTYVLRPNLNASGTDVAIRERCGCAGCDGHHHWNGSHHDGEHHWNGSHHDGEHHHGTHHDGSHHENETDDGHCGHHDG